MKLNRKTIDENRFEILTDLTNEDVILSEDDSFITEAFNNQIETVLNENGFNYCDRYFCHIIGFHNEFTVFETIDEAIQYLALKEGVDLVRFKNGRIGFVGYYGNKLTAFELIKPR